jgi:hypothetical protein
VLPSELPDIWKSLPTPKSSTTAVPECELLTITTVPLRDPLTVGVRRTVIWHDAPTASEVPQVLVWEKSPLEVIEVIVNAPEPELVTVLVFELLVVPTITFPKSSEDAERVACGTPAIVTVAVAAGAPGTVTETVTTPGVVSIVYGMSASN